MQLTYQQSEKLYKTVIFDFKISKTSAFRANGGDASRNPSRKRGYKKKNRSVLLRLF
jgi:hypothetical protein